MQTEAESAVVELLRLNQAHASYRRRLHPEREPGRAWPTSMACVRVTQEI